MHLNLFQVWTNLVASQSLDNERVVVNLRHLTEMLSQQSEDISGGAKTLSLVFAPASVTFRQGQRKRTQAVWDHGVQLMTIRASKGLEFESGVFVGARCCF